MNKALLVRNGKIELSPIINKKGLIPLLKVEACGVCATDRKAFADPPASMVLPRVLGHECCGTLLVDLPHVPQGTRVALWPALACGACVLCGADKPHLCARIRLFGLHLDGGFSHTLFVPAPLLDRVVVLPLPAALAAQQAVFAEPLGCVLHALAKVARTPRRVMIHGAGLMGRVAAQAARCIWPAADIALHDPDAERAAIPPGAGEMVATPHPADLAFIACSSRAAVDAALDLLESGGTLLLFSGLPRQQNSLVVDHNRLHRQEQTLVGAYGCTPQDMVAAMELMAGGAIDVADYITKTLALVDLEKELASPPAPHDFKTIIVP